MRHGIAGNRLGRNSGWRKATVRDIAKATLIRKRITTTEAKAKEARKLVDRLITLGKKGTLAHKRRAFAVLCDHKLVSDLFDKIAPRFSTRNGGYTRIIKLATARRGDNAKLVFLELTERDSLQEEPKVKKAAQKKAKKTDAAKAAETSESAAAQDAGSAKKSAEAPKKEKKPAKRGIGIFKKKKSEE